MSAQLGKILLENTDIDYQIDYLTITYIKSKDQYKFAGLRFSKLEEEHELSKSGLSLKQIGEQHSKNYLYIDRENLLQIIENNSNPAITDIQTIGYKTPIKITDVKTLTDNELEYLNNIDVQTLHDISVFQYLFSISKSTITRHRQVTLIPRKNNQGRKPGSVNIRKIDENDLERINYNKNVSIQKRRIDLYLDACQEECHILNIRFRKRKYETEFNKILKKLNINNNI